MSATDVIAELDRLGASLRLVEPDTLRVTLPAGGTLPPKLVEPAAATAATGFRLLRARDLRPRAIEFLVRGWIARDTVVTEFGGSGTLKSFLAIDLGCCVATAKDWHGHQVQQGPVVFVIGEGHAGFRNRLEAWAIHNGRSVDDAPIFISEQAAALTETESVAAVALALRSVEKEVGAPALLVIDTLARNFGSGDENATADMGRFVNAVVSLARPYRAAVLVVHHTGHVATDRARGAYALKAAADMEIFVERPTDAPILRVCTAKPPKDFEAPEPIGFQAHTVLLGYDGDDPITSLAIARCDPPEAQSPARAAKGIGGNQRVALDLLRKLYAEHCRTLEQSDNDPSRARVALSEWRDAIRDAGVDRRRIGDAITGLADRGAVRMEGVYVYLTGDGP